MQNVKNETYSLKVEKLIRKTPAEVFQAIGEGRLFLNCGASNEDLKIDFKVGGKYSLEFLAYGVSNNGEFKEIIPNEKIVFTWCQNASVSPIPDTVVTLDLKNQNEQTLLTVTHTGFTTTEGMENHTGGWNSGLTDLDTEMAQGQLKFNRYFEKTVPALYETVKTPATFFGLLGNVSKGVLDFKVGGSFQIPTETGEISGKFLEIIPNEKIVFSWASRCGDYSLSDSKVTLNFEADDDNDSWLELIQEGLKTKEQQKKQREGWDWLLNRMLGKK